MAHQVSVAVVLALNPMGLLYLVVDDTLLHKRGKQVYGLGWFRDAVASTAKRVATASGNNWVVMGLAIPIPFCPDQILCLPLLARLHLPDKGSPSCVDLAAEMLAEILQRFPERQIVLVGMEPMRPTACSGNWIHGSSTWGGFAGMRRSTIRNRPPRSLASVVPSRRRDRDCPTRGTRCAGPMAIAMAGGLGCGATSRSPSMG